MDLCKELQERIENRAFEITTDSIGSRNYEEIGYGGYVSETSKEDLEDVCYQAALRTRPEGEAKLIWRVTPEYEQTKDFSTGRIQHRIYMRLAWLPKRLFDTKKFKKSWFSWPFDY